VGLKRGRLELAEGGTLFLNEIGELPLPLQAKLLTFLETKQFTRLGGVKPIPVNARLIAATNRDLETEVKNGAFRKDLYFRLASQHIMVPPLRDRREDIPLLVSQLMDEITRKSGASAVPCLTQRHMELLVSYHWPGNVRELKSTLDNFVLLWPSVSLDALLSYKEESFEEERDSREEAPTPLGPVPMALQLPLQEPMSRFVVRFQRTLVAHALWQTNFQVAKAAKLLHWRTDYFKKEVLKKWAEEICEQRKELFQEEDWLQQFLGRFTRFPEVLSDFMLPK
jgi:transcriptional regulator with GAF, ATPase, and Fis domain